MVLLICYSCVPIDVYGNYNEGVVDQIKDDVKNVFQVEERYWNEK